MPATEQLIECRICQGSGLYPGPGATGGITTVCRTCNGSGAETISFVPFTERHIISGVERVFAISTGDIGGVSYDEWLTDPASATANGAEARGSMCPSWWYNRVDETRQPKWAECSRMFGRSYLECPDFTRKEQCWNRWDQEQASSPRTVN